MKDGYKSLSDDDLLKVGVNKFKGFMQTMGTASKKASDTVKVLGKGVSKETEKALEKYVHYSEEKQNHGKSTFKLGSDIRRQSKKTFEN